MNNEIQYKFHGELCSCVLLNISELGVLLKINQVLLVGDIITINIDIENYFQSISLEAEVRHVNNQYAGLKFLNINGNDMEKIKEYISEKYNKKFIGKRFYNS
jgi:c-di-GMP-binding flagellar brake protein YcgR